MGTAASPAEAPPRLAARPWDPDRLLAWSAWVVVAISALQVALLPFGRDQGIYAVVGEGLLHGEVPYRDIWDFKPPGIFAVHALGQLLFGHRMIGPRLVEVVGLVVMVLAMRGLSRALFGKRLPGIIGGAIAALIHAQMDFWHSGQPESFAGFLTVIALWLVVIGRALPEWRQRLWRGAAAGVCFGLAFLLKPPHGGGALVCAAYLAQEELRRGLSRPKALLHWVVMGGASVVPILLTVLWFAAVGGFSALSWTFLEFVPGYTALAPPFNALQGYYYGFQEAFVGFSALAPVGVVAALALPPMHGREREGLWLFFGVICLQVAGIAMQGKFFQYHYGATLPLIAFMAGLGLYKLWRRALRLSWVGMMTFALGVGALAVMRTAVRTNPGGFWHRAVARIEYLARGDREDAERELYYVADYDLASDRAVAEYVASVTKPGDSIYVWGFEPVIYWIARRAPSSAYIYDVPQRATWNRAAARDELMADLARRRPAALVVQHGDRFDWVTGDRLDSAGALRTFPRLSSFIDRGYELATVIDDFDVYLPRSPGS